MLDRLRHAAKVRTEQRSARRLGIGDDERARIVPDGRSDHDVDLPVEFIGRHESHELDPCMRRQCSQALLFLIAQAAGNHHPDPIGRQHGQRSHEIVDALLLGDPSDEAECHFRRADRPRVG